MKMIYNKKKGSKEQICYENSNINFYKFMVKPK